MCFAEASYDRGSHDGIYGKESKMEHLIVTLRGGTHRRNWLEAFSEAKFGADHLKALMEAIDYRTMDERPKPKQPGGEEIPWNASPALTALWRKVRAMGASKAVRLQLQKNCELKSPVSARFGDLERSLVLDWLSQGFYTERELGDLAKFLSYGNVVFRLDWMSELSLSKLGSKLATRIRKIHPNTDLAFKMKQGEVSPGDYLSHESEDIRALAVKLCDSLDLLLERFKEEEHQWVLESIVQRMEDFLGDKRAVDLLFEALNRKLGHLRSTVRLIERAGGQMDYYVQTKLREFVLEPDNVETDVSDRPEASALCLLYPLMRASEANEDLVRVAFTDFSSCEKAGSDAARDYLESVLREVMFRDIVEDQLLEFVRSYDATRSSSPENILYALRLVARGFENGWFSSNELLKVCFASEGFNTSMAGRLFDFLPPERVKAALAA